MKFRALIVAIATIAATLGAGAASAQSAAGFRDYLEQLRPRAQAQGITQSTLNSVIPTLEFTESVIRIDREASGGGGTGPIPRFTGSDEQRAAIGKAPQGRELAARWRTLFVEIQREYGVPAGVILAIYGKETNFGGYMGRSDVLSALATLAYEGRRRTLFESELIAAMQMVQNGVPRYRLTGSWAGAMGRPQFMPSVYLRLARDGDGDGEANIWDSEADALFSIAHYLHQSGWRGDQPWGIPVALPQGFNRAAVANRTTPTRCPRVFERHSRWITMAEWRAMGVRPVGRTMGDDVLATLLEPDGPGETAYLLTQNYRAILDYNCSNFYAMAVGLLSDEISR